MTVGELCVALASLAVGLVSLLLIFGLTTRLRALERIARQRKLAPQIPQPGHAVLPLEVASTTGPVVSAASLAALDRALVCFFTSGCSKVPAPPPRPITVYEAGPDRRHPV